MKRKELLKIGLNTFTIIMTLVFNGFFTFLAVGWDWKTILTQEYWISYLLTITSAIMIFVSVRSIRATHNLKQKKITDKQTAISDLKLGIKGKDKVREAKVLIREYHNYKTRLEKYSNKIEAKVEALKLEKPFKDERNYEKKLIKYNNKLLKDKALRVQEQYIRLDYERLALLVKLDKTEQDIQRYEEIKTLLANENEKYGLFAKKIKFEIVTWETLISDSIEQDSVKRQRVGYSDKRVLSKELPTIFFSGAITGAIINVISLSFSNGINFEAFISIMLMLIYLSSFALRGILSSDKSINGVYSSALDRRIEILQEIQKDLDCVEYVEEVEEQ